MRPALLIGLWGCAAPDAPPAPEGAGTDVEADASHADLLTTLDADIAFATRLADEHPDDWTRLETLAGLHHRRARLVGGFEDLAIADDAIARAFDLAPDGSGPWLAKARLDFSLHRLDRVEPSLDAAASAIVVQDRDRAEIARMRGDVALQRGDHAGAAARYAEADAVSPGLGACYGTAQIAWWEARFDVAARTLDTCEGFVVTDDPQTRAWFDLQRGLVALDQGRWEDAESHYRDAGGHLDGWYLVDEHEAEVALRQGRVAESEAAYRDVIARTDGPEFMDALARLLIAHGRAVEGRAWALRAEVRWRATLDVFPEAAGGHALAHFLEFGSDPEETLALARADAALRPNGAVRVTLARALLATDRDAEAQGVIDDVLASPYRSAALYEVAAILAERRAHSAAAEDVWHRARPSSSSP